MQYQTGVVNLTNGSAVVTGVGTYWSSVTIPSGALFSKYGETAVYQVASVDSTTQITLTSVYAGTDSTSSYYEITIDFTPNFEFSEISAGDRDWPSNVTVGFIRKLDSLLADRLQGLLSKTLDSTAEITLTSTEYANQILEFEGTTGGSTDIILPAIPYRQWTVYNNTDDDLVFLVSGQTGVTVATGKRCIVYANGTDIVRVTPDT